MTSSRQGELMRAVLAVLRDAPDGLPAGHVLNAVEASVPPTPFEASTYPNNPHARRYERMIRYLTINAVKAGWMIKDHGRWSVTDEGVRVCDDITDPAALFVKSRSLFWEWKKAQRV